MILFLFKRFLKFSDFVVMFVNLYLFLIIEGEELYTQNVFLFRQFSSTDIFIAEKCEGY